MADASGKNRRPQDEEEIANNRSGKGSFDDAGQPFAQRHQTNDEFRSIAKRCIQEATDARSRTRGNLLGRAAQPASQRDNSEASGDKKR